MSSDLESALAFVARRQSSRAMPAAKWAHLLSFEMGWMNPGQARSFVQRGVHAGLLAEEGDLLRLVIDPRAVEVPRGFRPKPDDPGPSTSVVAPTSSPGAATGAPPPTAAAPAPASPGPQRPAGQPAPPDPFLTWVARLAAQRGLTRDQVLGQVADLQAAMAGLLTAEAAVLLLARRNGADVAHAARDAEAAMQRPRRPVQAQPSR